MGNVILGNHSAVRVRRAERDRIRRFYRDILGCKITGELDDKDDFRMEGGFYFAFLYERVPDDHEPLASPNPSDRSRLVTSDDRALQDNDFLRAIYLELKSDAVQELRQKIVAFGVKVLDVPDSHLYFQAPGGQVFRLVGIDEDLSRYEGVAESTPRGT